MIEIFPQEKITMIVIFKAVLIEKYQEIQTMIKIYQEIQTKSMLYQEIQTNIFYIKGNPDQNSEKRENFTLPNISTRPETVY